MNVILTRKKYIKNSVSLDRKKTIIVFDVAIQAESPDRITEAGIRDAIQGLSRKVRPTFHNVSEIQRNVTQFLTNIQEVLDKGTRGTHQFDVDTIEINAEISADGQIGFMGSGFGGSATTGIKFILKRVSS